MLINPQFSYILAHKKTIYKELICQFKAGFVS